MWFVPIPFQVFDDTDKWVAVIILQPRSQHPYGNRKTRAVLQNLNQMLSGFRIVYVPRGSDHAKQFCSEIVSIHGGGFD